MRGAKLEKQPTGATKLRIRAYRCDQLGDSLCP